MLELAHRMQTNRSRSTTRGRTTRRWHRDFNELLKQMLPSQCQPSSESRRPGLRCCLPLQEHCADMHRLRSLSQARLLFKSATDG